MGEELDVSPTVANMELSPEDLDSLDCFSALDRMSDDGKGGDGSAGDDSADEGGDGNDGDKDISSAIDGSDISSANNDDDDDDDDSDDDEEDHLNKSQRLEKSRHLGMLSVEGAKAVRGGHCRGEMQQRLGRRIVQKKKADAKPPEPVPFAGIAGCLMGMPKFAPIRRAAKDGVAFWRVKNTAPSKGEKEDLWPGTIFTDEYYGKTLPNGRPHPSANTTTYRVHQTITDYTCSEPTRWQLMYYDIALSHEKYGDGAPCDCDAEGSHGGKDCKMECSTICQVVEWLEKYAGDIPAGIDEVA